jgi:hypothetical protein
MTEEGVGPTAGTVAQQIGAETPARISKLPGICLQWLDLKSHAA